MNLGLKSVKVLEELTRFDEEHSLHILLSRCADVRSIFELEVSNRLVLDTLYLVVDTSHEELQTDKSGCETQIIG